MENETGNTIPFLTHWLQEIQMDASLPAFTESLRTLTITLRMIHTIRNQ